MNDKQVKLFIESNYNVESTREEQYEVQGSNPVYVATREFYKVDGCELSINHLCGHHCDSNLKHEIDTLIKIENCPDGKMYF